jgi:putative aldouronate transport system permease protein
MVDIVRSQTTTKVVRIDPTSGVSGRMRETRGDRIFNVFNYSILVILFLIVAYPLIYVISASFSDADQVVMGNVWLYPVEPTLDGYKAVFKHKMVWTGYANSFFYMIVGTAVNVSLTVMAAYPLSRKDYVGRKLIMFMFVFTMMFNGGLIPTYLLVKSLGLLDTRAAMILPTAIGAWNVIITRTFLQSNIPDSMLEAAQMDGCSDFRFVAQVVLPLSGPIIAVITLFYAVHHWNQYFQALIYLRNQDLYPLQIVLRDILVRNQVNMEMMDDIETYIRREAIAELLKYSLIVFASVPVLVMYPFVQRYFVRGIMIGSIKG